MCNVFQKFCIQKTDGSNELKPSKTTMPAWVCYHTKQSSSKHNTTNQNINLFHNYILK